jgi:predicted nucleotidyltransferase
LRSNSTRNLRKKVAKEAALLLYTSQEKEFKQAKHKASVILGVRVLPSNIEIAYELDRIAEEREGFHKREMLLRMRQEAKQIMEILKDFNPCLMGSVWRGTARKNSDIDIQIFSEDYNHIIEKLQKHNYKIECSEHRSVTKAGIKDASFHVHIILKSKDKIEIVIRNPNRISQLERCETYGDLKTGLTLDRLCKILKENPLQKFTPVKKG